MAAPKPHIRNPLVRTVYNRMLEDEKRRNDDHSIWYKVNVSRLSDDIGAKLVQCTEDEETREFLELSEEKSDWIFTQLYHLFAKAFLSWFMTNTTINGLIQRGSMFVLSTQQFRDLMGISPDCKMEKLLDLGAGDGKVTEKFASHFTEVCATETSITMQWRLQEKSFRLLGVDEWQEEEGGFDVISALNLLDRCDAPASLLRRIRGALRPGGAARLLLAVVLPFKPYVEFGRKDHKPTENLHVEGTTFEEQVESLVRTVFEPAGFRLQTFTRVPYLCEGDLEHSFYYLDDAVFVLAPL